MKGLTATGWLAAAAALIAVAGCHRAPEPANVAVLYCSVDDVYVKPLLPELEQRSGVRIRVLYDTEAAKTAGLATRIRAERKQPRGDVFWSSALLQTLLLQREGLLQPYRSPSARDIPNAFKAADGSWSGAGLRSRLGVFHVGVKLPGAARQPRQLLFGMRDLLDPRFKNRVGISNPQFGTASDWAAALGARWGIGPTLQFFQALKRNGVHVLAGNSVVADHVARGDLLAGVCDPDDYMAQVRQTHSLFAVAPYAAWPASGAVLVPGSVAILRGAPHPAAARRLVDAILYPITERHLALRMRGLLTLHAPEPGDSAGERATHQFLAHQVPNDSARWAAAWDQLNEPLARLLLAP